MTNGKTMITTDTLSESQEDIAMRMYPSMAPPASSAAAPAAPAAAPAPSSEAPTTEAPAAEQLPAGPDVEDLDMKAVRDDPAYRMFGVSEAARALPDNVLDRAIGEIVEVDGEAVTLDREMVQTGLAALREMAADLDLTTDDMAAVAEGLNLGESLLANPEAVIAARERIVETLNAEHGQEAALAARCARAYVAKNPKLANLLERTGAGDSPQAARLIARRALSLHKAGKLKLPSSGQAAAARGLYAASKMNP